MAATSSDLANQGTAPPHLHRAGRVCARLGEAEQGISSSEHRQLEILPSFLYFPSWASVRVPWLFYSSPSGSKFLSCHFPWWPFPHLRLWCPSQFSPMFLWGCSVLFLGLRCCLCANSSFCFSSSFLSYFCLFRVSCEKKCEMKWLCLFLPLKPVCL